jgi:predicted RNA binding protein YcfA (HicA-like mRNA interferase family)
MSKLRTLSGRDLIQIFSTFGFQPVTPRGSHVKLRRVLPAGSKQTLTIVLHDELDKGTLRAIYRAGLRFIQESELRPHFYTED